MSIWSQYTALADYITLKYQSELQIVHDTVASLVEEQHKPESPPITTTRQNCYSITRITSRVSTVTRAAPSIDTYETLAHSTNITPENIHHATAPYRRPHGIWQFIRGPPRCSIFAQKAALRRVRSNLFAQNLSRPELVCFLFWEATHGFLDPQEPCRYVFQQQERA